MRPRCCFGAFACGALWSSASQGPCSFCHCSEALTCFVALAVPPHVVQVKGLDALPEVALQLSEVTGLVVEQLQDEGNRALLTLLALLGAVLYLRAKLRRPQPAPGAPNVPGFAPGPVQ